MNRLLGTPFWIAAQIASLRARFEAQRQQDRAYRLAVAAERNARAQRRPQLMQDENE